MSIFEAIIQGIIQGFTEFLPVSSSGHLVLAQRIFNMNEGALSFTIALHLATLVSVVSVYWRRILEILKRPLAKLPVFIVIGTIPMGILGVLFHDWLKSFFETGVTLGFGFLFTGFVLLLAQKAGDKKRGLKEMNMKDPLIIGTAQALAMVPAISRSGMTISTSLALGIDRKTATEFSFLLSIPAILGPAVYDIYKMVKGGENVLQTVGLGPVVIGMLFAGICGFIAVKSMIKLIHKNKLHYFSYYLWSLGALVLLDQLIFNIVF